MTAAEQIDRAVSAAIDDITARTSGTPENYEALLTALLDQAATLVFARHVDISGRLPDPAEVSTTIRRLTTAARAALEQALPPAVTS